MNIINSFKIGNIKIPVKMHWILNLQKMYIPANNCHLKWLHSIFLYHLLLILSIPPLRQKYVRAHFNYSPKSDEEIPCQPLGLKFEKGDILEISNQDDPDWWQVM